MVERVDVLLVAIDFGRQVLTVAFTLGWVGINAYLLTWIGPIGGIVGFGLTVGAVAGGLRRRQG